MTVLWYVDALVHSASAQRSDSCGDMFSLRPLWREERQSPEGRTCNFSFVGESVSMRHRKQKISGTGSALFLFVFFTITDSEKLRQFWSHRHAGGHIRIFWWKSRLSSLVEVIQRGRFIASHRSPERSLVHAKQLTSVWTSLKHAFVRYRIDR